MTVIVFVILLGVLVLVHEFGHFFVARRLGIRVEEFGFGFPPRMAHVTRRGVRYSFNLLPIGGFVKIFGEQGEGEHDPLSFASRPVWQRFLVLAAGVFMNIVLAWFAFSLVAGMGMPTAVDSLADSGNITNIRVTIVGVAAGSPAERAGIRFGDSIDSLRIAGEDNAAPVTTVESVQQFIDLHRGKEISMTVVRGRETITKSVLARNNPPQGEGSLGIVLSLVGIERASWRTAPIDGMRRLWESFLGTILGLYHVLYGLFTIGRFQGDVSGPIGIFVLSGEVWTLGISYFLQLAGMLSLNLAILNALPFPALDGGRMFFLLVEKIKGSKVDQSIEYAIHTLGFVVLIALMMAVTYRDVTRFF